MTQAEEQKRREEEEEQLRRALEEDDVLEADLDDPYGPNRKLKPRSALAEEYDSFTSVSTGWHCSHTLISCGLIVEHICSERRARSGKGNTAENAAKPCGCFGEGVAELIDDLDFRKKEEPQPVSGVLIRIALDTSICRPNCSL